MRLYHQLDQLEHANELVLVAAPKCKQLTSLERYEAIYKAILPSIF